MRRVWLAACYHWHPLPTMAITPLPDLGISLGVQLEQFDYQNRDRFIF
jgi:hypothetical protein